MNWQSAALEIYNGTSWDAGSASFSNEPADGNWPEHTLLVDVKRGESDLIPIGDTRLRAGDFLYVLTDDTLAKDLRKMAEGE